MQSIKEKYNGLLYFTLEYIICNTKKPNIHVYAKTFTYAYFIIYKHFKEIHVEKYCLI